MSAGNDKDPVALFDDLVRGLKQYRPDVEIGLLLEAYGFAWRAHRQQWRESGEPYIVHPIQVARILLDLLRRNADLTILAASLLHDTIEDSREVTYEDVERDFGSEVALLVDGVTKISDLPFRSPEVRQSETYRKMLLSMAKDIRVILIKLADRLHNMRTLDSLSEDRRKRTAQETLDIYAPIAHRLGIAKFKWELEDLAFKHIEPANYWMIVHNIDEKRAEREAAIEEIKRPIVERLKREGIEAEVRGRPKHLRSIWMKMQRLGAPFEEIYDLLGIRILTKTRDDCYRVLGVVHDMYTPVPERFKDYIATPKSNMYQSLHTTVIVPEKRMVEIQIRTWEMHVVSEIGIAAHYAYKEGAKAIDREMEEKLGDLVMQGGPDWEGVTGDPKEFMEFLRTSLYQDEVFVFTPKGGLKHLPRGSTPIDFAYAVHTDIGHRCVGARVNGRLVPLRYQLKSGEVVEVITSPHGQPSEDWLDIVATSRAKAKIRRFLAQQRMEDSIQLGKELLQRELRKRRIKFPQEKDLEDVSQSFGFPDVDLLYAKIGQGDISAQAVAGRLQPQEQESKRRTTAIARIRQLARRPAKGIRIGGVGGLLIRIAQCCQPIPGDKVVGIITKGRGISVHRVDCPNTFEDRVDRERLVEVEWDVEGEQRFMVRIEVTGSDRPSLLADVASAIGKTGTNMQLGTMSADGEGGARGEFVLEVKNLRHLRKVLDAIAKVRGVRSAERVGGAPEGGRDR